MSTFSKLVKLIHKKDFKEFKHIYNSTSKLDFKYTKMVLLKLCLSLQQYTLFHWLINVDNIGTKNKFIEYQILKLARQSNNDNIISPTITYINNLTYELY
jgi:hypothetical protein